MSLFSTHNFPDDHLNTIFSYLGLDRRSALQVSKKWNQILDSEDVWEKLFNEQFICFGKKEWEQFGEIQAIPSFAYKAAIQKIVDFSKEFPKEWDRKTGWLHVHKIRPHGEKEFRPITLNLIGQFATTIVEGSKPTGYGIKPAVLDWDRDKSLRQNTFFAYMSPENMPGSDDENYKSTFVPEYLYAMTGIFLKFVSSKRKPEPFTWGSLVPKGSSYCKEEWGCGRIFVSPMITTKGLCIDFATEGRIGARNLLKIEPKQSPHQALWAPDQSLLDAISALGVGCYVSSFDQKELSFSAL